MKSDLNRVLVAAALALAVVAFCRAEPSAAETYGPGGWPELDVTLGEANGPILSPLTGRPAFGPGSEPSEGTIIPPHERAELSADAAELVAGNNQFAVDLYRHLAAESGADENVLVSPLSISAALAMTYAGARGRTAEQMAAVLRFTLPNDRFHPAFGEVIRDLDASREGYQLSIANRLFGQQGFDFRQPFLEITERDYGAPLEELDFVHETEDSRQRINGWVEEKTNDKIRNLLPQGSVNQDTRLVLTNAIYFHGSWKYKFDDQLTHDAPFYAADGSASQVDMMFQHETFRYGAFDAFQMLEMPYAGDDLSMVLMLPGARDGLAEFEASLTSELIRESLDAMHEREVLTYLPKFSFDAGFKLRDTLSAMGMPDAFGDEADLTGIADGGLAISDVLHKAFIDVNEEGTEAAAATAVVIGITGCFCDPPQPTVFRADHPFLFALRDRHSGSLMFLGRVAVPGESAIGEFSGAQAPEPSTAVLALLALVLVGREYRRRR